VRDRLHDLLQHATAGRADAAFMFFRVGYASAPSLTTERPSVEPFISTTSTLE
jgi:hypothetical protein